MNKPENLKQVLEILSKELKGLPVEDVVRLINDKISCEVDERYIPHYQIRKAMSLRHAGQILEAADLLSAESRKYDGEKGLHYYAGEYYLEAGDYSGAIYHLSKSLDISSASGDPWYKDAAYTLRAYGYAKIGEKTLSYKDLDCIGDDGSMGWVDAVPPVSKNSIQEMLKS